jgi:hypothetical protein
MNTLECISLLLIDASVKHHCMMVFETVIDTLPDTDIAFLEAFIEQRIPESHTLFFTYWKPLLSVRIQPKISASVE